MAMPILPYLMDPEYSQEELAAGAGTPAIELVEQEREGRIGNTDW